MDPRSRTPEQAGVALRSNGVAAAYGYSGSRGFGGRLSARHVAAALAFLVLWFAFLEQRPLWDPDEGRYAEIPREMVASGDWITPRLNDLLYFEKPPLQYWATAAAYEAFGESNWTARLWAALTGLAGVLLAFYAGLRLHSARAGLYSAAMLASSTLYFALAHINTLDMGLCFFLEVIVVAVAVALSGAAQDRERKIWAHLAWLSAAFAVLTKGLVAVVLPAAALIVYSIAFRDFSILRKLYAVSGGALFLLVCAPWFIAVTRANPDFAQFFFIHEHFTRFLTTEHHRAQPWWFFVPVLILGAFPWTAAMLAGWWRALRRRDDRSAAPFQFLAVWVLLVMLFFSASGSKLIPYILPVFPALALLGARYVCDSEPSRLVRQLFWPALIPAVLLAAVPVAAALHAQRAPGEWIHSTTLTLYALAAAALWTAGATLAVWMSRRGADARALLALAVAAIAAHQLVLAGASSYAPSRTAAGFASQLKPHLDAATRVYTLQSYPQSLPVYLGRTVTLVEFRGELDFGLKREPQKGIPTVADFVEKWRGERNAIAVMAPSLYAQLAAAGVPMVVVADDHVRVAVKRP